jgi:phosphoglycolate phosphatase-like HAD superfamily hydrolase
MADALDEVMKKRGYSLMRQQLIESTWGFVAYVTKNTDISVEEAAKAVNEANEMVGDRDKDIVAAKNASMDSVLFCSAEHQKHCSLEKLLAHKPTYVISEFRDLIKIAG